MASVTPTGPMSPVTADWVTTVTQAPALTTLKQVDSATYGTVGQPLTARSPA